MRRDLVIDPITPACDESFVLELASLVWRIRVTGRQWRTKPMPRPMANNWLYTAQKTGLPAFTCWIEPVGRLWSWTVATAPHAPAPGWGVRRWLEPQTGV